MSEHWCQVFCISTNESECSVSLKMTLNVLSLQMTLNVLSLQMTLNVLSLQMVQNLFYIFWFPYVSIFLLLDM